jgi:hypothetical protein
MRYSRQWIGQGVKQRFIHLCEVCSFNRAKEILSNNCPRATFLWVKVVFKNASDGKKMPKSKLLIKPDPRSMFLVTVR